MMAVSVNGGRRRELTGRQGSFTAQRKALVCVQQGQWSKAQRTRLWLINKGPFRLSNRNNTNPFTLLAYCEYFAAVTASPPSVFNTQNHTGFSSLFP